MSTPLTVASSATSLRSLQGLGSPILAAGDSTLNDESRQQEYTFEGKYGTREGSV